MTLKQVIEAACSPHGGILQDTFDANVELALLVLPPESNISIAAPILVDKTESLIVASIIRTSEKLNNPTTRGELRLIALSSHPKSAMTTSY